jgi:hypothetical protein
MRRTGDPEQAMSSEKVIAESKRNQGTDARAEKQNGEESVAGLNARL